MSTPGKFTKSLFFVLIMTVAVTAPGSGFAQVTDSLSHPAAKYLETLRLMRQGQHDIAIAGLKKIIDEHPSFHRAYSALVLAFKEEGNLDEALLYFQGLLSADRNHLLAPYGLGLTHTENENFEEAARHFKLGIKRDLTQPASYVGLVKACQTEAQIQQVTSLLDDIIGSDPNNGCAYLALGYLNYKQKNWPEAVDRYKQALEILRTRPNAEIESEVLYRLGLTYLKRRKHDTSVEYFKKCLQATRKIGDKEKQFYSLSWLAIILDDPSEKIKYGEQAMALIEEYAVNDYDYFGGKGYHKYQTFNGMGFAYQYLGDYSKAIKYFTACYDVGTANDNKSIHSQALGNLGGVYNDLGDYATALETWEKALRIAEKIGSKIQQHHWIYNIGVIALIEKDYSRARKYFEKSLEISRTSLGGREDGANLYYFGEIEQASGNYEKALAFFSEALVLAKNYHNYEFDAYLNMSFGEIHRELGNIGQSLQHYNAALAIAQKWDNAELTWRSLNGVAMAHEKARRLDSAFDYYEQAIEKIENIRRGLTFEEHQSAFGENALEVYHNIVALLAQLDGKSGVKKYAEIAFNYSEQARARTLLGLIAHPAVNIQKGVPAELLAEKSDLQASISRIQSAMRESSQHDGRDPAVVDSLEIELEASKKAIKNLRESIAVNYPRYASLTGDRAPLSLQEIQRDILAKHQILLQYVVGDSASFVFVVTKDTLHMAKLMVTAEEIEDKVTQLFRPFREISNLMEIAYDLELAHQLYLELFQPIEEFLSPDAELIIVPDGALFYLPFESLVTEFKASDMDDTWYASYRAAEYLIEKYIISYSVSASLLDNRLLAHKATKPKLSGQLLAFGNPQYASHEEDARSLPSSLGWSFEPLRFSEDEIEAICNVLQDSKSYTGAEATEKKVKQESPHYNILHFSAHGLLDESQPLYSGIVLSKERGDGDDGILQAYEIFNLELNADLVTLSACQTGLGKFRRGEGIMGLTRAFLYAGAKSVLVSLWSVYDQSTTWLMQEFYQNLKQKQMTQTQALRAAKLKLMKSTTEIAGKKVSYAHPFFWSPFVLIGDADTKLQDVTSGLPLAWSAIVAALFLIVTVVTWLTRRRMENSSTLF